MDDLSAYRQVRTLVLGASGFIGRWVARLLSAEGADLQLGVRDTEAMRSLCDGYQIRGALHRVDLSNGNDVKALLESLRPDIVFNLAGYGVDRTERDEAIAECLNAELPIQLARSMLALSNGLSTTPTTNDWRGQALVHAGSALEFGPVDGGISDDTPSAPTTVYGRTKLRGAQGIAEACASGLRAVEGRIFTAYGPGEHATRLLPSLIRQRSGAETIALSTGDQKRDFIYVQEVAEALLRLGACDRDGFTQVNVARGELHSVRAFVLAAAEVLQLDEARLGFGQLPYLREEMWHGEVSVRGLEKLTGWVPTLDVKQGIQHSVEFLDRPAAA